MLDSSFVFVTLLREWAHPVCRNELGIPQKCMEPYYVCMYVCINHTARRRGGRVSVASTIRQISLRISSGFGATRALVRGLSDGASRKSSTTTQ